MTRRDQLISVILLMAVWQFIPEIQNLVLREFGMLKKGDSSTVSLISMGTHTRSHIDAPSHFIKGGKSIDEIPLERMNGVAKVFDFTEYQRFQRICSVSRISRRMISFL